MTEWRNVESSFAQFAEDLLVLRALDSLRKTQNAYYVDVGAYHPVQYSNALRLRLQGWRGINIDPQPENIRSFHLACPDDVNLHLAVARERGKTEFLCYDSRTTGRLTNRNSDKSILGEEVRKRIQVEVKPLAEILQKHAFNELPFGFLSVDCEGADLEVLQSNDWETFRPWIIAVEDHKGAKKTEIDDYCMAHSYKLFALAHITKIFVDGRL